MDAAEAIGQVNLDHVDWAMAGITLDDGMDDA